jgi:hypothetical protein
MIERAEGEDLPRSDVYRPRTADIAWFDTRRGGLREALRESHTHHQSGTSPRRLCSGLKGDHNGRKHRECALGVGRAVNRRNCAALAGAANRRVQSKALRRGEDAKRLPDSSNALLDLGSGG